MTTIIGIIGGTGFYKLMKTYEKRTIATPYGNVELVVGIIEHKNIAFLPRHGEHHTVPPHMINHKANIYALKSIGADRIVSVCATGSLKEKFKPGDIVIPDQFIDFGKDVVTFYNGPDVYHVSLADPFCPQLRECLVNSGTKIGLNIHSHGIYLRISGPRFSTKAESQMFRGFADLIGMTGVPEAVLSREQALCHAILATITDYDVWAEKPVSVEEILKTMEKSAKNIELIIKDFISSLPSEPKCGCAKSLKNAKI